MDLPLRRLACVVGGNLENSRSRAGVFPFRAKKKKEATDGGVMVTSALGCQIASRGVSRLHSRQERARSHDCDDGHSLGPFVETRPVTELAPTILSERERGPGRVQRSAEPGRAPRREGLREMQSPARDRIREPKYGVIRLSFIEQGALLTTSLQTRWESENTFTIHGDIVKITKRDIHKSRSKNHSL